jgi:hypothetical protein
MECFTAAGTLHAGAHLTTNYLRVFYADIYADGSDFIGDNMRLSKGLAIGYTGADPDDDSLELYYGTTLMGQLSADDTTWFRINQNVAKNIYTVRGIRVDGGIICGSGLSFAAGEIGAVDDIYTTTGYFSSTKAKHAVAVGNGTSITSNGVRITWSSSFSENEGSFYFSDSYRRVHVPEAGCYNISVFVLGSGPLGGLARVDAVLYYNGSTVIGSGLHMAGYGNGATEYGNISYTRSKQCSTGDYFDVRAASIAYGASLYTSSPWCWISIVKVN